MNPPRKNAPPSDKSRTALLLIDVINDMEFPNGQALFRHALPTAQRIAGLKKRATAKGIPTIYVNDNFGRWKSDFRAQINHCLQEPVRGRDIAAKLLPAEDDYFVLKPKHSAFFSTTLDVLLEHLGVHTLILTGFAADICVLYTANDAYMRDFRIIVPSDCVASEKASDKNYAIQQMKKYLRADVRSSRSIKL